MSEIKIKCEKCGQEHTTESCWIKCLFSEMRDASALVPNPRNPNKHDDIQVITLTKLIVAHGWRQAIIVSERSGFVVCGHGRLQAAIALGMEKVPIEIQSYENEAEEWAVMLADNFSKDMATYDGLKVADMLNELDELNYPLELTALNEEQIGDYIHGPKSIGEESQAEPELILCPVCGAEFKRGKESKNGKRDCGASKKDI